MLLISFPNYTDNVHDYLFVTVISLLQQDIYGCIQKKYFDAFALYHIKPKEYYIAQLGHQAERILNELKIRLNHKKRKLQ